MFWNLIDPVLAANDGIVTVVIVIFTIIGWIVKIVGNAQEQKKAAEAKKPARRTKTVDDEISVFLDEVEQRPGGQKPAAQKPATQRPAQQRPAEKPKPQQKKPTPARTDRTTPARGQAAASRPQGNQRPVGSSADQQQTKRTTRPGEELARRGSQVSSDLGQQVQQHLQTYMADRIAQQVSSDVSSRISASVTEHLGQPTATATVAATVYHTPTHPIVAVMQNPTTLRQSMMVSMVLAPPIALSRNRK